MEFRVTYDKEERVIGKVMPNCEWGKLSNDKKIKYLEFKIGSMVYTLGGFKEYNIKKENYKVVEQGVLKIFIFARGETESFILCCEQKPEGVRINEMITPVNQEYGNIQVMDWRNGEFDEPYAVKCDIRDGKIKGIYDINNKREDLKT